MEWGKLANLIEDREGLSWLDAEIKAFNIILAKIEKFVKINPNFDLKKIGFKSYVGYMTGLDTPICPPTYEYDPESKDGVVIRDRDNVLHVYGFPYRKMRRPTGVGLGSEEIPDYEPPQVSQIEAIVRPKPKVKPASSKSTAAPVAYGSEHLIPQKKAVRRGRKRHDPNTVNMFEK